MIRAVPRATVHVHAILFRTRSDTLRAIPVTITTLITGYMYTSSLGATVSPSIIGCLSLACPVHPGAGRLGGRRSRLTLEHSLLLLLK